MEIVSKTGKLERPTFEMPKEAKPRIEHEFQAIGLEFEAHFGKEYKKRIWPLFYRYPLGKIKDAWVAYQKGEVKTFNYFCGILNKI